MIEMLRLVNCGLGVNKYGVGANATQEWRAVVTVEELAENKYWTFHGRLLDYIRGIKTSNLGIEVDKIDNECTFELYFNKAIKNIGMVLKKLEDKVEDIILEIQKELKFEKELKEAKREEEIKKDMLKKVQEMREKKIEVFAVNGTSYEDNTSWVCYNIIDGDSKRYSYEIMDNDFLGERSYEELSELFNSDEELFKKMTEKMDINKIDRSIKHLLEEFNDSENEMFYLDDWYMEEFMHITEEEEKIAYLKNVAKQADELGFADSIEVDEDMMCDDYVVVYGNAPTMVIY